MQFSKECSQSGKQVANHPNVVLGVEHICFYTRWQIGRWKITLEPKNNFFKIRSSQKQVQKSFFWKFYQNQLTNIWDKESFEIDNDRKITFTGNPITLYICCHLTLPVSFLKTKMGRACHTYLPYMHVHLTKILTCFRMDHHNQEYRNQFVGNILQKNIPKN